MDFDFYKLQTTGNDLILVNYSGGIFPDKDKLKEISKAVCRRDYGIGGNGFIAVENLSFDDIKAHFLDPSGRIVQPTSDAAFCLSRFAFDSGAAGKDDFKLVINDKTHSIGLIDSNNFRISMGVPLNEEGLELVEHPDEDYIKILNAGGRDFPASIVNLGKTGVVVLTDACGLSKMKDISDLILKTSQFESSQRLIFATVNSREELEVHIRNSRGDDCSSSCAIAAAASVVNGFLDRSATILHKHGDFYFQWLHPSNEIFLTGSADYIFSGSMFIDN